MDLIYTPKQMSCSEKKSEEFGVSLSCLMDNAGYCLAQRIIEIGFYSFRRRVLMLCGNGNNGGDGFVAADILSRSGFEVTVMLCCGSPKTELASNAFSKMSERVHITENCRPDVYDIICDCVFGTGFRGELPDGIASYFDKVNKLSAYKLACDLPSGVNALTGQADRHTIVCDETLSFHAKKVGTLLSPAKEYCKSISVSDISIPKEAYSETALIHMTDDKARELLPYRRPDGHKGTFGKVVCICGSERYTGAAAMSCLSALRGGCGLVQLCSSKCVIDRLSGVIPEATFFTLPDSDGYTDCDEKLVSEAVKNADCVLFGCGIGLSESTEKLLRFVLSAADCPVVIDADGINCLSMNIDILKDTRASIVLTPHPMELARLCGLDSVPEDRLGPATELCEKYGVTVMAKSAQTFVVSKEEAYLCDRGNTALSKGGSGDMLAGLTASLIAQGVAPAKACALASHIIGLCAQELCKDRSPRSVIARDIINQLPYVFFNLEG